MKRPDLAQTRTISFDISSIHLVQSESSLDFRGWFNARIGLRFKQQWLDFKKVAITEGAHGVVRRL
jgi:hypothetical protein